MRVAELWWLMLAGSVLILAGVVAAALYALKRERRGRGLSEQRMLAGWGLVFPLATLAALMAFALLRGEQLLARPDPAALTFEVEAGQWAWTVRHPGGPVTENVLHVPAGETFHVLVTSRDVIHSFWAPRLGGKIDAIPGKANRIALRADLPGVYRGVCAEYCGIGHAAMRFEVRAHPPEAYEAALAAAAADAPAQPPPVEQPRRPPASSTIRAWADWLAEWVGVR